jgi:hypothetical protein
MAPDMASGSVGGSEPGDAKLAEPPVQPPEAAVLRRVDRWAAFLLYVALVIVHLFLALTMSNPVVYSDEGGYMGTAHVLVSGTGLLYAHSPYHPGYSVLLVPIVALFPAPLRSYQAALILNAVLLAGVGAAAFELTRHFVAPRRLALRLAIATVVASYPAFLDYSNLIMSMNLFIPVFVALCVTLGAALDGDRLWAWLASGALAATLYVTHPVGLVAVVGLVVVALLAPRSRPRWAPAAVAMMLGLEVVLAPGLLVIDHVSRSNARLAAPTPAATAPSTGPAAGGVTAVPSGHGSVSAIDRTQENTVELRRSLSLSRLPNSLYELAGQLFYLTVATFGLFTIGIAVALQAAWQVIVRRQRRAADLLALFIGLVMLATLASSALRFNIGPGGSRESDELIYGRYNELVLAPTLLLGLVGLSRLRWRSWRQVGLAIAGGIAVVAASGAALAAGRTTRALDAVFVDVNVLALHPLLEFLGGIHVAPIAAVGAGAVAILAVLARWRGVTTAAVPVVAVSLLAGAYNANKLSQESDGRTAERVVISALDMIHSRFGTHPSCIAYDIPMEHVWHLSNDQFFFPRVPFRRFDASTRQRPCSDIVISGRFDLDTLYPGAGLVALENFSPTKLWVLPGPLLDRLKSAGDVLPPKFPSTLPASACHSTIHLIGVSRGAAVLPFDSTRDVILAVRHDGTGAPWPSRLGFVSGAGWVRLAAIWVARSDPLVPVAQQSVDLPGMVYPGQTVDVRLHLVPRDLNGRPLPPGSYVVRVGLVQDGYTYFTDKGDQTLDLALQVGRRGG